MVSSTLPFTMEYTLKEGKLLMTLAREAITSFFTETQVELKQYKSFSEKHGVFVTLFKEGFLRGSIGYLHPKFPLYKTVYYAAREAAFKDARFPPLTVDEFDFVEIELSLTSEPEFLKVKTTQEYLKKIRCGEDGVMIEGIYGKGVVLPQVAVDNKWGVKEFLNAVCAEAGLPVDAWHDIKNKLYTFSVQTFIEKNGMVVEKL